MSDENLFLLISFSTLLVVVTVWVVYQSINLRRQKQLRGVQWLQALRFLLMHLQKHRGLTTAFLSGNRAAGEELDKLKKRISLDIDAVGRIGGWINQSPDWHGITQHWAKLSGTQIDLGFEKNFSQHSKLVASVLVLLDSIANSHSLTQSGSGVRPGVAWHDFLWIGEHVGQCRALGVRILSMGVHNHQLEKHKRQVNRSLLEMTQLFTEVQLGRRINATEMEGMQSFVEFVRHYLLENTGIISANEFFERATETISLVYDCFDREMQVIHRRISSRKVGL